MAFSTNIKGHHHLQGNVQVYNVRMPAKPKGDCMFTRVSFWAMSPTIGEIKKSFPKPSGYGRGTYCLREMFMTFPTLFDFPDEGGKAGRLFAEVATCEREAADMFCFSVYPFVSRKE